MIAAPSATRAPATGWQLFCAAAGFGLVILHTTAVNIALPQIHASFGGDVTSLQWVVNAYALTLATLLLPFGAAADRFGARRLFRAGLCVFATFGLVSAAAPAVGVIVVGQAAAGVGAAMIVPTSLALVREAFPDERERARAIGKLSIGLAAGFGSGPLVGGALVGALGWRAVFLVDLPCALLLAVVAGRHVSPSAPRPGRLPATSGVLLGVAAVGGAAVALTEAGSAGWGAPPVIIAGAIGVLAAIALVRSQRRSPRPLVPRAVWESPDVVLAIVVGLFFNVTIYGGLFVLSLAFQEVEHATPFEVGLLFLPQTIGTLLIAAAAGHWLAHRGWRGPLLAGLALGSVSTAMLLAFDRSPFPLVVVVSMLVMGVAGGLVVPALHTMVAAAAPHDAVGIASAALNAGRQLGGVLGVAVLGSLVAGGDLPTEAREAFAVSALLLVVALGLVWWRGTARAPALVERRA